MNMNKHLEDRRSRTSARLARISMSLQEAEAVVKDRACVYLTGSFARGEAGKHSDLDLFIVGREQLRETKAQRALPHLDELCVKAALVKATREHDIPDFSGDGEYLAHYTVEQLLRTLGSPQDDASNTFTARLLLLLESQPLLGTPVYHEAIDKTIKAYWGEFDDHRNDFVPAFLVNDILRLWRTFCVNYEARTSKDPADKKAKRKLKNYKLKHSRLLTCYSALSYFLAVYAERRTVTPDDARQMVGLTPTQRLEHLATSPSTTEGAKEKVAELLQAYERFLVNTDKAPHELVDTFMDPGTASGYFAEANQFGNRMYELLKLLGQDTLLYRLLVV